MFRFALNREVWWPVELPQRGEKGMEFVKCLVLFRLFDREELQENDQKTAAGITQRLSRLKLNPDAASPIESIGEQVDDAVKDHIKSDQEAFTQVRDRIRGWKSIVGVDGDGKDVDFNFSDENLVVLLTDRGIYEAFHDGLLEASRGAKVKN